MLAQPPLWFVIIAFLAALGPLIIGHELGHYWVARWFGVGAETFSIGFGKEVAGFTDRRGTRVRRSHRQSAEADHAQKQRATTCLSVNRTLRQTGQGLLALKLVGDPRGVVHLSQHLEYCRRVNADGAHHSWIYVEPVRDAFDVSVERHSDNFRIPVDYGTS